MSRVCFKCGRSTSTANELFIPAKSGASACIACMQVLADIEAVKFYGHTPDPGENPLVCMYAVNGINSVPVVKIGEYTICRQGDTSVWIQHESGEGGEFADRLILPVVEEFYRKHF